MNLMEKLGLEKRGLKKLCLTLLLGLPVAVSAAQRPATPFTDAELDALLAPIALYPDTVLSHVLIAATVPEEVEAAAEWVDRHPGVEGQAAVDAVERKDWDPSVKALVAFPEVLERMVEDPDWTEDLGLAFLEQEHDVMDRVQYLRDRAYANGTLDDLDHVRVVREREYIYLEPAVSRVYYVPYYDPWYVYGSWWWPAYPPHRWHYWAGYPAHHYYGSSFYWGVHYSVGPSFYVSSFNWSHRHVVVSREHRHYTTTTRPSASYSGRSTMRRENVVAHHDSRHHRGNSRGWRHDSPGRSGDHRRPGRPQRPDRPTHPTHPTHPEHPEHPAHPGHSRRPDTAGDGRQQRRNWTEVRSELSARRNVGRSDQAPGRHRGESGSRRNDGGHRQGNSDRHDEAYRADHGGKGGSNGKRDGWYRESPTRAESSGGWQRSERAMERSSGAESRGHSRSEARGSGGEMRGGGRSEARDNGAGRGRAEAPSRSRGQGRGQGEGHSHREH